MSDKKKHCAELTLKQKIKVFLASKLGVVILYLLHASLRWEKVGLDGEFNKWADGEPIIGAFWHGRQLMIPWMYLQHKSKSCKKKMFVLISHHTDGRIISGIMRGLGIYTVFGSSTYGGVNAIRGLAAKIEEGHHVCFTPDGPRGPFHKAKQGVLSLAMLTGRPIYPATYSAEHFWQLHSWDGMIIPKPFSRAVYIKGEALHFRKDLNEEEQKEALLKIESALNDITDKADNWFKKS